METRNEAIREVVETLAARYKRRCWWADKDDLVNEGWLVALEAEPPDGADFRGYIWQVVSRRLSRFLWGESSPVSASKPERMKGMQRIKLDYLGDAWINQLGSPHDDRTRPELAGYRHPETVAIVKESLWVVPKLRKQLRSRLVRLYRMNPRKLSRLADLPTMAAVLDVLCDHARPVQAAKRMRVKVESVYRGTAQVKRFVGLDPKIATLISKLQIRRAELAEFRRIA